MKIFKKWYKSAIICFACFFFLLTAFAQKKCRIVKDLKYNWLFVKNDTINGSLSHLDESLWKKVSIPDDWAISGPFDRENDVQKVKVEEDGEKTVREKTGRTAGLPYAGIGWYRKHLNFTNEDIGKKIFIEFDGAMSHAQVFLNGKLVGQWPYGYSSFCFDLTPFIILNHDNVLAVRLQNEWQSSRWYPGAGLYRHVRLLTTNPVHIAHWGTFVHTTNVSADNSTINIETTINCDKPLGDIVTLETRIYNADHELIKRTTSQVSHTGKPIFQTLNIHHPNLWSAEKPYCYQAESTLLIGNKISDRYETMFGIRDITFKADSGMLVNGVPTKLRGVCLHGDLGPLGTAVNNAAMMYRLKLLKKMGCNAIRGAHNPQDPELLNICDKMGFYYVDEAFDEWKIAKVDKGYHLLFDNWAEKDLQAMIYRDRNHPSVIMYSIGNEVKEQEDPNGNQVANFLKNICHQTDPTRPVTAAFNNWKNAIDNGLADAVDIPGWNYKPEYYFDIHKKHPAWPIYGSETASTVSSRGAYELPAIAAAMKTRANHQSSAYDLEYCSWSQLPDLEWKNEEQRNYVAGEFVWTGFDYLGEPTPYGSDWPSRSSYFGIIDLCGIPKDRYYLYQSHWSSKKVLHILPQWNWAGMQGKIVPVFVYTNYPSAEVFINGKSFGRQYFDPKNLLDNYRLRWSNTIYEPGELKVVSYDDKGRIAETRTTYTSGRETRIQLHADRVKLKADGEDLSMITATITDKQGNLCPYATNLIHFKVSGAGKLRAVGNGDPTSLASFQIPQRNAFYGKCMVIIQTSNHAGNITVTATANQLNSSVIKLKTTKSL